MINFIISVALIALVASWTILFMTKTGAREYIEVHAPRLVAEMFSCDFCLAWWLGVILSAALAIGIGEWIYLCCPFFSTTLTRRLL